MASTSINVIMLNAGIFILFWAVGLINIIPIDWLQALVTGNFGNFTFDYSFIAIIYNCLLLAGVTGIVGGLIFPQRFEQALIVGTTLMLIGYVLAMFPVASILFNISPILGAFFGLFICVNVFIIFNWWRSAST